MKSIGLPTSGYFAEAVTNAGDCRAAYSCGAVTDSHRLPVHSASFLKINSFLGWYPVTVRMFDIAHFRDAIRNRNDFVRSVPSRQHNVHMRRTRTQNPNHIVDRNVTVAQNVIELVENNQIVT